tara:strand:+ start:121 stop:1308 length:1188 start_codon:yes stop_codon:yes gene_type:complete
MAMGTWRVDPVENRKLQVESGVDKSKLLGTPKPLEKKIAGGTEQSKTKKSKPASDTVLRYPYNAAEQSRDSLVIKCIEYIPPMKSAASGITFGGQEVADFKNKKTGEIKKDYVTSSKVDGLKWNFGQSAGQRSTSKKNEKVKYYVKLPIPQNVNDSHGVTWGESTMNLFELVGLQAAQNFMEDPGKAVEQYTNALNQLDAESLGLDDSVMKGFRAAVSGTALNTIGSNVTAGAALARSTGQILNSNRELLFEGVRLRSFPFNIQFSPRSSREANQVMRIIKKLKQSMSPKKGAGSGSEGGTGVFNKSGGQNSGGMFIKSPDIFTLEYRQGSAKHPFLNSFKTCALTQLNVNYTGAGTWASYNNGSPVKIIVDMTFKEIDPVYAEDYDEIERGVGY